MFVNQVLAPFFWPFDTVLLPILLGVPGQKGGRANYERVRKDVLRQLKQQGSVYCTTMIDFYRLGKGFPGSKLSTSGTAAERVKQIESEWKTDICSTVPDLRPDLRFIPYLCLHSSSKRCCSVILWFLRRRLAVARLGPS